MTFSQFSSVTQSCLTLCDPMNYSTPGFPVHHQLPEPTQTHVHGVSDAILPSHLLRPLLLLPSIFPSIRVFSNKSALHIRLPKYWSFRFNLSPNEHTGLISYRTDWLDLLAVQGTLKSLLQGFPGSSVGKSLPVDDKESSPTSQLKSINSSALSFLYSPTLRSIHDHWKNHSLD